MTTTGVARKYDPTMTTFSVSAATAQCSHWFDGAALHLSVITHDDRLKMFGTCAHCGTRVVVQL